MIDERAAEPGELCTCGRPAVVVFLGSIFGPTGWCGRSDGGEQAGACPSLRRRPPRRRPMRPVPAAALMARATFGAGHAMDALFCACGCGATIDQSAAGRAREFASDACRARAWRVKQQRSAAVEVWDLLQAASESTAISALAGVDRRALLHLRAVLQRAV